MGTELVQLGFEVVGGGEKAGGGWFSKKEREGADSTGNRRRWKVMAGLVAKGVVVAGLSRRKGGGGFSRKKKGDECRADWFRSGGWWRFGGEMGGRCKFNQKGDEVKLGLQTHNSTTFNFTTTTPFILSTFTSLPTKNALRDVKDQAEDKANPKPWYTTDEKSSKMSTEDLLELIREYPLPEGWYASLPGLQEPANYGTKFKTGIYEEQAKSGYRLPLHPFALHFFKHYHMAPEQLVPNGCRKLVGLIYLVQTSGYKPGATDFIRVFFEICFVKVVANCPGWYYIHAKGKRKEKHPSVELPPALKKTIVTPPDRSPQIVERVSIDEDPIFRPRWTLRGNDIGMPDSYILEQHLMYTSGFEMLSRFEMARQVAAEEAQQKKDAIKEAEEATHHTEELSKQEVDYLA
ncbi:hypothetical protein RJ639_022830 [Escallonia herrerae]|uniref:Transposase (putative) gypsy type domain-containing protein n=1 Tax=Escallonia herrerae TaxID=1293975 RepID=A0AA89AEH9_9ASTE|nr:hypothetical protein RJ639_022830 [Escallonia herrerae]